MAPSKRASVAKPAPAPKKAKVEAPLYPILAELQHGGLIMSCVEMLSAALPHALETPTEERHSFQTSALDNVVELSNKEREKRDDAVREAEAKVAAHTQEKDQAQGKADEAQSEEQRRRESKQAAEANVRTVTAAADAAAESFKGAQTKLAEQEIEVDRRTKAKEAFATKVSELWGPLKEGNYPKENLEGLDKKDRQMLKKAIDEVAALVAQAAAPKSLTVSLALVLKNRPSARGAFAVKTVEEGERVLNKHTTDLEEAIGEAKVASGECSEEVSRAESMMKDANVARDQAQDDCIKAENEWLEAEEAHTGIKRFIADAEEVGASLASGVEEAKASLATLDAAIAHFNGLLKPPAPAPVEVQQEGADAVAVAAEAPESMEVTA